MALEHFDRAIELAEKSKWYQFGMLAQCWRALLPNGDVEAARKAVAESEDRAEYAQRMEAHFVLWKATGDREQIDTAHSMLEHLREHAPPEYRDSMVANVPLHRDIAAAWGAKE